MEKAAVRVLLILSILTSCQLASAQEFNTVLMESTFRIVGKKKVTPEMKVEPGKIALTSGTVFIIGLPVKNKPEDSYNVLVTAAHVLEDMEGDIASLILRKKNPDGSFQRFPKEIKIRENGKPLYTRHTEADVAVMYLALPSDMPIRLVPISYLATDKTYEDYEIHPGDQLFCLGYPLFAEANDAGFSILRSGRIASYPLIPAKKVKSILFDFHVYPGNSGGPVYMSESGRVYKGEFHYKENTRFVIGLISQQASSSPELGSQRLELALVVPAQFILETISMLQDLAAKPETTK